MHKYNEYLVYNRENKGASRSNAFLATQARKLAELEKLELLMPTEVILRMRVIISDLYYGKIKIHEEYEKRK